MRIFKVIIAIFFSVLSVKISHAERIDKGSLLEKDSLPEHSSLNTTCSKLADNTVKVTDFEVMAVKQKRPFALKSNLLYWVAATPNISAEFYLSDRLSLNTEVGFAWWSSHQSQFYWQIFAVSPELRYWFCQNNPFHGHYAGVYLGGGIYDVMFQPLTGDKGYQGEFCLSAGVSYGYMFPIGRHLSLEAGLSVGYLATNYREYVWGCSKYMSTDTKRTVWIGPTKINLTLVWQISR